MVVLLNTSAYARLTVRPNKPKRWGLEQTKVYGRAKQEVCVQERHELFSGFQGKAVLSRVCGFLLIGDEVTWWHSRISGSKRRWEETTCSTPDVLLQKGELLSDPESEFLSNTQK